MRTRINLLFAALLAATFLLLGASAAGAQEAGDVYGEEPENACDSGVGGVGDPGDPECEEVLGETVTRTPQVAASVESNSAGLPVTGGDVTGLALLGGGAIALGSGFVLYRRRHEA